MQSIAKLLVYSISLTSLIAILIILYDLRAADGSPASIQQAVVYLANPASAAIYAILFVGGGILAVWSRSTIAAMTLLPTLALSFAPIIVGSRSDLAVPRGAIVAFSRQFDVGGTPIACPAGWSAVAELAGKVPVGAGIGTLRDGTELTPRGLGDDGGAERHVLTVPELPSHTHPFSGNAVSRGGNGGTGRELAVGDGANFGNYTPSGTTATAGKGEAHENMPPFWVVQFCRLD